MFVCERWTQACGTALVVCFIKIIWTVEQSCLPVFQCTLQLHQPSCSNELGSASQTRCPHTVFSRTSPENTQPPEESTTDHVRCLDILRRPHGHPHYRSPGSQWQSYTPLGVPHHDAWSSLRLIPQVVFNQTLEPPNPWNLQNMRGNCKCFIEIGWSKAMSISDWNQWKRMFAGFTLQLSEQGVYSFLLNHRLFRTSQDGFLRLTWKKRKPGPRKVQIYKYRIHVYGCMYVHIIYIIYTYIDILSYVVQFYACIYGMIFREGERETAKGLGYGYKYAVCRECMLHL